jgi:predicted nucleic acid-binding protein
MPVNWRPTEIYEPHRDEAERRIAERDLEDWPTVALALALSLPVWLQDKDIARAGLASTRRAILLDAIRSASSEEI